jgi:hydrogenase maturation protein HypF
VSDVPALVGVRLRVEGTVQGVGFRPFVYRLASELGLDGWVRNDAHGVLIEAHGAAAAVEQLAARLVEEAPALAVIERLTRSPAGELDAPGSGFAIRPSPRGERPDAPVTPDSATCAECLRELFDPADRRHRYPFINCTNCGPRFTIVRGVPYDRPLTTMASFAMCDACRAEYEDPADRRFHAQPNACPACGPRVRLLGRDGRRPPGVMPDDPLEAAAVALRDGAILAVKGIGGYHLACRADDERAVSRLRARKHREDKPFALMAATVADAERLVALDAESSALLRSPARPIVLAPRLDGAEVAPSVAPGAPEFGVMLPYSPLHHLLLADFAAQGARGPLVMTSGNVSDEPIAFEDGDALARLSGIAELFLTHNRPIETRVDDSVRRVVAIGERRASSFLRRSRGYVPASLPLAGGTPRALLACGGELKSTFCLARGERAWVSHHIGDLENYETLRSFTDGIAHLARLFDVQPEVVVHDLHPEYLSTKHALSLRGLEALGVQHHHAHLAACLAEHGIDRPAVGAILDGTGYGLDGTVWGGEILVGDLERFERAGWLLPVPMPGGERAIREPWRMALAWLDAAADGDPEPPGALAGEVGAIRWRQVLGVARGSLNAPLTSSVGRLFDAVAALCGVRAAVNYEGQAAIELEACCDPHERGAYRVLVDACPDGSLRLDPRPAVRQVVADLRAGSASGLAAARFHNGMAGALVEACQRVGAAQGLDLVVLSGGVFQNRRLLGAVVEGLAAAGLQVLTPSLLPANDGGISFGQAAVAARRLRS